MRRRLSDHRTFFQEFRRTFHTTGAVMPSGRALCTALSRHARNAEGPKRVLEVGPGTGVVTAHLVDAMGPGDHLDLVELNDRFVARLRQRFLEDHKFQRCAGQTAILHMNVEKLSDSEPYDVVVSGLPLNNFESDEVRRILNVLVGQLRPGGVLSFFEYIAVRRAKILLATAADRRRLRGIAEVLGELFRGHKCRREPVWPNVPPAWVHHIWTPAD